MPDIELTYNQAAVDALLKEAVEKERERCAVVAERWLKNGELELRCGEVSSQEKRTVRAVVRSIFDAIRALPTLPEGEK